MTEKQKLRVLIVEDSESDAELLQLELKRSGFALITKRVDSENEMRSQLLNNEWDLITTDFRMPNFSAYLALEIWKEFNFDIPFFVVSGVISNEEAVRLIKAGATEYILKDDLSRLGTAVTRELKDAKDRREKKRISLEFAASQRLHRMITENMTDSVWIMDIVSRKITYINPAAALNFGYSVEEIEKLTINHFLRPESLELMRLQMKNAMTNGGHDWESEHLRSFQLEYRRKDGSYFWSEDILDVITDDLGQPTHVLGVGRDITERKKQEQEVIRSREYIWTLFENFPALIWRSGLDGKCNYFNKSWLNWTGRSLEQELNDGWTEGIYLDDLESYFKIYKTAIKDHQSFQMEHRLRHASGEYRWVINIARPYNDPDGHFAGYIGSCYDIHEEHQNRVAIIERSEIMNKLYEITRDLNHHQDMDSLLDMICEKTMELMDVPVIWVSTYDSDRDALIVKCGKGYDYPIGSVIPRGAGIAGRVLETEQPIILDDFSSYTERLPQMKDAPFAAVMTIPMLYNSMLIGVIGLGEVKPSKKVFRDEDLKLVSLLANTAASAIHNAKLYESVQTNADQLAMLYDAGLALNSMLEPQKQLSFLLQIAQQALNCARTGYLRYNHDDNKFIFDSYYSASGEDLSDKVNKIIPKGKGSELIESLIIDRLPVNISNSSQDHPGVDLFAGMESILFVPVTHGKNFLGIILACDPTIRKFSPADERLLILFGNQTAVALENSRMFTDIREHTLELETLSKISEALRPVQRSTELMPVILQNLIKLTRASLAVYVKPGNDNPDWVVGNSVGDPAPPPGTVLMPGLNEFLASKEGVVINLSELNSKELNSKHGFLKKNKFGLFIPMFSQEEKSGYLFLAGEKSFEPNIIQIIRAVSDMAANAIQRATLHEETRKRLDYISALHTIDSAITSSSDLAFTLSILVDQIKDKLKVDAVTILLSDRTTNYLNHAASIGFYNNAVKKTRIRIGESYAGKAAMERQLFRVQDYDLNSKSIMRTSPFLNTESFVDFIGNPLIVKGKLVGVLEIFNRQPLEVDDEWFHFLNSIAQQAAIAIDNSKLFEELEKSNINLMSAYDSTLEGWSRALELRDRETEGHSKRVVDMTVEIALQMGLPPEQLIHIRRGALLHDIGKLGIPDSILLKPGNLTPDERKVMEQHPVFAKNLLSTIDYLKPVINIPYCHHEKWDGSGYPNGLSGELIPIEARIFAIIDVFDALTSDRPYRKAWTNEASLEYIKEQSGKYFDPAVAKIFLTLNAPESLV